MQPISIMYVSPFDLIPITVEIVLLFKVTKKCCTFVSGSYLLHWGTHCRFRHFTHTGGANTWEGAAYEQSYEANPKVHPSFRLHLSGAFRYMSFATWVTEKTRSQAADPCLMCFHQSNHTKHRAGIHTPSCSLGKPIQTLFTDNSWIILGEKTSQDFLSLHNQFMQSRNPVKSISEVIHCELNAHLYSEHCWNKVGKLTHWLIPSCCLVFPAAFLGMAFKVTWHRVFAGATALANCLAYLEKVTEGKITHRHQAATRSPRGGMCPSSSVGTGLRFVHQKLLIRGAKTPSFIEFLISA